jgi:hypothetical protein
MQAIRNILVVMQPEQPESLALKRAKLIAGVTQSHIHLLVCDKKHDHSVYLNDLCATLNREGFNASGQQAWHENLNQTILTVQQAEGCGLVVKQHFPDNPLKKALLTPDAWKLLRYCPAPVLLVTTDSHGPAASFWRPWMWATPMVNIARCIPASSATPSISPHWLLLNYTLLRRIQHPCCRQRTQPSS